MDISSYEKLLEIICANETDIISGIISLSKDRSYFKQYAGVGLAPESTVSEIFVKLLMLSLRIGDTENLKEQYAWALKMLGSRGLTKEGFIVSYSEYMDIACKAIESHTTDEELKIKCRELFDAIKEEFVKYIENTI
ncbi:MAG: hypothetical protein N2489_04270 [Clostridia bacterium]|nr:hypothetical protein [Clostridia bacterium]